MHLTQTIAQIETTEEIFALLDVRYEPAVLNTHRVQLLQRFGAEIAAIERRTPPLVEEERLLLYTEALARIHEHFVRGDGDTAPMLRRRPRDLVSVDRLRRESTGMSRRP
jgi:hypothetical protein